MTLSELLVTKMRIPPQPQRLVTRARLKDALEHGAVRYKLTLVTAPAGYGKTTLLADWAHDSQFPVVWLSLSEEDNDLYRVLRYLVVGWNEVQPGIKESPVGLLLGTMTPDRETVLSSFVNVADEITNDLIFVLDDYHLIEDPAIHETLSYLIMHMPPEVHFVLASRAEPSLPLARYRARHELLEFRADELYFSLAETTDFLNKSMTLGLTEDEIAELQARLEGWPTGLQLAALTLRSGNRTAHQLQITGRHRFIADYLAEDVLGQLPDEMRQFLLLTSILDRLCGPLCDAVTGGQEGQMMLESLERENLFLVPLDDDRRWFRYHHLFADFLQSELQRQHDDVAELHHHAARWYFENEHPEPAFQHAMAAGDIELAVRIVDRYVAVQMFRGEYKVAEYWLDSFSDEQFAQYPALYLYRAIFLVFSGQLDACIHCLNEVEQRLENSEPEGLIRPTARLLATRTVVACLQQDLTTAEGFAIQAFPNLSEDDLFFQCALNISLGDIYRTQGQWQTAQEHYLAFLDLTRNSIYRFGAVHPLGALADLQMKQGQLRRAADYWQEAISAMEQEESWGTLPLPLMGWIYVRLADILYEWNKLPQGREHLSRGLELAELGGDVRALIAGYLTLGRVNLAEGDVEAARQNLEQVRPLVENAQFREWRSRFERFRLELWLVENNLTNAVTWRHEVQLDELPEGEPVSAITQLMRVRALLGDADATGLERALALLDDLTETADAEGRKKVYIEALALRALVHRSRGEQPEAILALEHALRLAEPEGYVRLFADLGLPMARLLQEARSRDVMLDYVEKLLAVIASDLSLLIPSEETLPEPLTPREQEVLELIAAGLTYRETAEELIISPETVKKHVGNIYSKLAVGNRTEALIKAREFDLLD